MAMLAEPRQRKTYNLVPRGKPLYEDDCRFGTKMLKKMGWDKDKGLGANEDGTTEFVRVQYKNNVKGLGFEDRDDQWTQHEQSFTGLLENLNGVTKEADKTASLSDEDAPRIGFGFPAEQKVKTEKLSGKISGESLEEKSKRSKVRVHYKKFTRGKDLTRYSEKDLANIFGKKAVEQSQDNDVFGQLTAITINPNDSDSEEKEKKENCAGVQTVNTGVSVSDYFKQKIEAMRTKKNKKSTNDEPIETEQDHSEIQSKVIERSLKREHSPCPENCNEESLPKKKKKKKDKKEHVADIPEQIVATEPIKDLTKDPISDSKNVKRKKEKKTTKAAKEDNIEEHEELEVNKCDNSKKNKVKKTTKIAVENTEVNTNVDNTPEEPHRSDERKGKAKKSSKTSKEDPIEKQDQINVNVESTTAAQNVVINNKVSEINNDPDSENENQTFEDIINSEMDRNDALDITTMSVDELRDAIKADNVLTISTFNAERFRNCQLDAFKCANIANINGYSYNADIQINIKNIRGDQKRIMELWTGKINKYADQMPRYTYQKYVKSVFNARNAKVKKLPKLHVKTFKRMQVFQTI